jgi:hypothetical protein
MIVFLGIAVGLCGLALLVQLFLMLLMYLDIKGLFPRIRQAARSKDRLTAAATSLANEVLAAAQPGKEPAMAIQSIAWRDAGILYSLSKEAAGFAHKQAQQAAGVRRDLEPEFRDIVRAARAIGLVVGGITTAGLGRRLVRAGIMYGIRRLARGGRARLAENPMPTP